MSKTKKRLSSAGISDKVVRILEIYTLLARNRYPDVSYLTDKFEVSRRSVFRYLEIINMLDPIEFDEARKGYRFVKADRLKKLALSEDEFSLLLTFGDTVSHLGAPLKEHFHKFVERLMSVAWASDDAKKLPIIVRIPDAIEGENFAEHFQLISESLLEKCSLELAYQTRDSREINTRRIDPYGLVYHDGSWIMIGYCHLREDVRRFALDRIKKLKKTNFRFKGRKDFDLSKNLAHSWGVYDEKDVVVRVRFAAEIADLITRKAKWHPSEHREVLPSGDVELTFTVAGVTEIKKWIYTWLPNVEVVEPGWFREQVQKELQVAGKRHN